MAPRPGTKPWNWRGEPIIEPRGYVLIFVGKDHPLADCRGYAYQHRLVEHAKAPLQPGEIVHHDDAIKSNNSKDNLVRTTQSEHRYLHRKLGSKARAPGEPNIEISCACGCGSKFPKFDSYGRPRTFVSGHNLTGGDHGRKN